MLCCHSCVYLLPSSWGCCLSPFGRSDSLRHVIRTRASLCVNPSTTPSSLCRGLWRGQQMAVRSLVGGRFCKQRRSSFFYGTNTGKQTERRIRWAWAKHDFQHVLQGRTAVEFGRLSLICMPVCERLLPSFVACYFGCFLSCSHFL